MADNMSDAPVQRSCNDLRPEVLPDPGQAATSGLSLGMVRSNSRETPIPASPTRTITKGHDSYTGIPGDGIVPG